MEIGDSNWRALITEGALRLGVHVSESQVDQFAVHARELVHWNRRINLTAITDPEEMAIKHFVDSIAAVPCMPSTGKMLDIGSGAGFPGIPLKIVCPAVETCLVDSVRKKVSFQSQVIRLLQLREIFAHHGRVEDLARHPDFQHQFNVIICRAFSSLNRFVHSALPLLAAGGTILAMKGNLTDSEIDCISDINVSSAGQCDGGRLTLTVDVNRYRLPELLSDRSLAVIRACPG